MRISALTYPRFLSLCVFAIALAAGVTACGGGGASSSSPSLPVTSSASPSPVLNASYSTAYAGSTVNFSCGCTAQAGTGTVAADGSVTLAQNSPATPASPNPTYTIAPGRNYVVIATTSANQQAWTTVFAGSSASRNQFLGGSPAVDSAATLASLYIFEYAPAVNTGSVNAPTMFDDWNFATVSSWVTHLRTSPTTTESHAMADIATEQSANHLLYPDPGQPSWNRSLQTSGNATIKADLQAIHDDGTATAKPTPCPISPSGDAQCTNAPSP